MSEFRLVVTIEARSANDARRLVESILGTMPRNSNPPRRHSVKPGAQSRSRVAEARLYDGDAEIMDPRDPRVWEVGL